MLGTRAEIGYITTSNWRRTVKNIYDRIFNVVVMPAYRYAYEKRYDNLAILAPVF